MRGKKSYNIRNIEAHLQNTSSSSIQQLYPNEPFLNTNLNFSIFRKNAQIQPSQEQQQNEFVNAKFGVSKYASNLVSGKMFKKI